MSTTTVSIKGVGLPVREFVTEEKNQMGAPLAYGLFLNFSQDNGIDNSNFDPMVDQDQEDLINVVRHMGKGGEDFKPPYMVMDLALKKDVNILLKDEEGNFTRKWREEDDNEVEEDDLSSSDMRACVKVLMSCVDIADLTSIGTLVYGMSVVKCNAAVPNYRWFQAANLLLKYNDQTGRVIPFPLEQEDGTMMYQMLRVGPDEYKVYQDLLSYAVQKDGMLEGFKVASKFAYEVLVKRGVPFEQLTHDVVDKTITHIHMMTNSRIRGVLLANADREFLSDEDLQKYHYIFY